MLLSGEEPSPEELRKAKRFVLDVGLRGTFGALDITLRDVGQRGVQAEHAGPLKLGQVGKLAIVIPGAEPLRVMGEVVWSRLSKTPDGSGKYLYRSGIRVDQHDAMDAAVSRMLETSMVRPDKFSLEKKKKALAEKRAKRLHPTFKTVVHQVPRIPTDQVLLIQQARERLHSHPDEAVKWYNRAKFSLTEAGDQAHYRDEIVAVWEYLERTIDISVIAKVFGENK